MKGDLPQGIAVDSLQPSFAVDLFGFNPTRVAILEGYGVIRLHAVRFANF